MDQGDSQIRFKLVLPMDYHYVILWLIMIQIFVFGKYVLGEIKYIHAME